MSLRLNASVCASICLLMTAGSLVVQAQAVPPETANEARIDRLLSQMTLEEKMNLIRGDHGGGPACAL